MVGAGGRAGQASRGWQCGAAALCNAQSLGLFYSMLQRLCKILVRSCKLKTGSSKNIHYISLLCLHRLHVLTWQLSIPLFAGLYLYAFLFDSVCVLSCLFTCDVFNH